MALLNTMRRYKMVDYKHVKRCPKCGVIVSDMAGHLSRNRCAHQHIREK